MSFDHVGMMLPIEIVQMFQQLLLRNNCARPMDEIFKNSVFRGRDREPGPGGGPFAARYSIPGLKPPTPGRDAFCATYESFDPGKKLSQIKWLAEIVVRSRVQQIHNRLFTFLCGENEDRSMELFFDADLAEHADRFYREASGRARLRHTCPAQRVRARFSVRNMIHRQSGFAQSGNNILGKPLFVFD